MLEKKSRRCWQSRRREHVAKSRYPGKFFFLQTLIIKRQPSVRPALLVVDASLWLSSLFQVVPTRLFLSLCTLYGRHNNSLKGHPHDSIMYPRSWAKFFAVRHKYYGGLRDYYGELREFPDKSSNFGLLYGRVYGPLI